MGDESEFTERGAARSPVLRSAQIILGSVVYDCVVLDISLHGARIKLKTPLLLPEVVILRLRDGSTYSGYPRWTRGTEIGLKFAGPPVPSGDQGQSRQAFEALEALRSANLIDCMKILDSERFFGDEALRHAADALEAARKHLEQVLRPHTEKAVRAQNKRSPGEQF